MCPGYGSVWDMWHVLHVQQGVCGRCVHVHARTPVQPHREGWYIQQAVYIR